MAEIKFRCPECGQKIAVSASAVGVKIDCPTCHSRLVIPRSELAPVEVLVKRRLAIVGGSADAVYSELQKAQTAAERAADELARVRSEHAKTAAQAQTAAAALQSERDALASEVMALNPLRDQLAQAQKELSEVRQQALTAARERDSQLEKAKTSEAAIRGELTALHAKHAETEGSLAAKAKELAALQEERNSLAASAASAAALGSQLEEARKELDRTRREADDTIHEHQTQLEQARQAEAALKAELNGLQSKQADAETRLATQTSQFAALKQHCSELEASAANFNPVREQLARAERQLEESQRDASRAIQERDDAIRNAQAAETLTVKLSEAERRIAAFNHGFTALKQEREEFDARLANAERSKLPGLAAAREESQELRAQLAEMGRALDAAGLERVQAVDLAAERQNATDKLSSAMATAELELGQLREELNTAARERGRASAALDKATQEGVEMKERLDRRDAEAATRKEEMDRVSGLLDAAQAAARAKDAEIHQLTAKVGSLTGLVEEKEKTARQALDQAEQYRAKNLDVVDQAGKAKREPAPPPKGTNPTEEERTRFTIELARKSAELDALKEELSKFRQGRNRAPSEGAGAAAEGREQELEGERDALRAELDGVKSALERAKQHVSVLQARRDLLRDEVATLRTRLGMGGEVTTAGGKPGAT